MSRIIIKNLPSYCTDDRLRNHIRSQPGCPNVTDARIIKNRKTGISRNFGFVGFATEQEAKRAIEYWNDTYMDTRKIEVAPAQGLAVVESRAQKRNNEKLPSNAALTTHSLVSHKRELNETMETDTAKGKRLKISSETLNRRYGIREGLDEDAQETTIQGIDEAYSILPGRTTDGKTVYNEITCKNEELITPRALKSVYSNLGTGDLEWLENKIVHNCNDTGDKYKITNIDTAGKERCLESQSETKLRNLTEEKIEKTARLFLRNLPFSVNDGNLKSLLEPYGVVEEILLPCDSTSRQPLGHALISFEKTSDAVKAWKSLDGSHFMGRLLHVIAGEPKRILPVTTLNYSEHRKAKEKNLGRMGSDVARWNSLYMNVDAVVDSIASRHSISKNDLLKVTREDAAVHPAVKQALAESQAITETKTFFKKYGIDFGEKALDLGRRRVPHPTIIIMKNFPFGITVEEINVLFGGDKSVQSILIPPVGTIALVEMVDEVEVKLVLKRLAYKSFKGVIIYLERAPKTILRGANTLPKLPINDTAASETLECHDPEEDTKQSSVLYVKNLSFRTTQQAFQDAFRYLPGFKTATLKTKKDTKLNIITSMGYGFVEFSLEKDARIAKDGMQGHRLDDHVWSIEFAGSNRECSLIEHPEKVISVKSKTLVIKNLPFEISKKEIRDLFSSFGTLKSVRLPKKFDNSTRGFAFVEFLSEQEVARVMRNVDGIHLLGRRLILEPAVQNNFGEDELVNLRTKQKSGIIGGLVTQGETHNKIDLLNALE